MEIKLKKTGEMRQEKENVNKMTMELGIDQITIGSCKRKIRD